MRMNDSFTVRPHPDKKGVQILIGDVEVQDVISSYHIFHSGNDMPDVTLTLDTIGTNNHYDASRPELVIDQEQYSLLCKFGWTPPEE